MHINISEVAQRCIQLKDLSVAVRGVGKLTVHQLRLDIQYTMLLMSIPICSYIYPAQSIIASLQCELVNVGSSVSFSTGPDEVTSIFVMYYKKISTITFQFDYGVLAACYTICEGDLSQLCLIQLFEPMNSCGVPVTNDYDCPLLSLTSLFPSTSILQSVSIMHECTSSCQAKSVNSTSQVERQCISSQKLTFVCDFSHNSIYSLNIYCMHLSD